MHGHGSNRGWRNYPHGHYDPKQGRDEPSTIVPLGRLAQRALLAQVADIGRVTLFTDQ